MRVCAAEDRVEQRAQVRVLDGAEDLAQVGLHLVGRARRPVAQAVQVDLLGLRGAQPPHRELRPVARMHAVGALHADRGAGLADLEHRGHVVHDQRRHRAGAIGQPELQVLAALALRANLTVTHEEDEIDILSVGELFDEHCWGNARWAIGG